MFKELLRGFGSILSVFPLRKPKECKLPIPTHTDEEAIRKDWEMVGLDIKEAARSLEYDLPDDDYLFELIKKFRDKS